MQVSNSRVLVHQDKCIMLAKFILAAVALVGTSMAVAPLAIGLGHGLRLDYARSAVLTTPLAVAHAAPLTITHAAPLAIAHAPVAVATKQVVDYVDAHPAYKFEYSVHDAHTGDAKQQSEARDGDVVHGSYSLVEPDGSHRTVEYTADDHNGFNAIVHRTAGAHPAVLQKVAVATPVALKAAPLLATYHH